MEQISELDMNSLRFAKWYLTRAEAEADLGGGGNG